MGAKEAGGGVVATVIVLALVGARVYLRYERTQHYEQRTAATQALRVDCKRHAHELMDHAPDAKTVGPYLHKLVDADHEAAWEVSGTSREYCRALLDMMSADAAKAGDETASRSIDKLKQYTRAAGEEWWTAKAPGRG